MGIFSNYYNKSQKETNKILDKMLSIDIYDIDISQIKNTQNLKFDYTKDEADLIMLYKYDRKSFLKELKRNIKPQVLDNMAESLNGKTKSEIEKEKKEEAKRIADKITDPELLEAKLSQDEKNSSKENKKDNIELKLEIIKSIYMKTLNEYYDLIQSMQTGVNGQIKTGSITNGSKIDNKMLNYQLYLRKLDLWYRNFNHGVPIGFNNEIRDELRNREYKRTKNLDIANDVRQNKIENIEELKREIEHISNKMLEISNSIDNNNDKTQELLQLKREYATKKLELASLNPTIGILHSEQEQKEKMEMYETREGITKENEKYNARILGQKINSMSKGEENESEEMLENTDNLLHENIIDENLIKAEKALDDFEVAMDEERYEDAVQSILTANSLMSIARDNIEIANNENCTFENAKKEASRIKENEIRKERNNSMGIDATYSDEEIFSKDLANELKGISSKYRTEIVSIRSKNDRCR